MPPKQKEAKKGPNYKVPVAAKDIVPVDIKQPPRELKSLKYPENFVEPPKNDKKITPIFESWPVEQVIKAFDFGINSQNQFEDPNHEMISNLLQNQNIADWKSIHEIDKIKAEFVANQNAQSRESINENEPKNVQEFEGNNEKQGFVKDPVIIETYERDETQEQMQTRLKDEAQKAEKAAKDKKKAKKQESKEVGPIKVNDVKMSDIKVQEYMPEQTIWIGSQLQTIKLRNIIDPYAKEPVWKKIYPQENGVPQITKSGKYWVKLYYMGQAVKIQVDDRIPLNSNYQEIFPTSQKKHEKWTLILTKALLKYFALAWPNEKISGSGLIIHALTGMLSQTITLNNKSLQKFENLLNDEHYTRKDVFVSCFTDNITVPPSNYIKSPEEARQFALQIARKLRSKNSLESQEEEKLQEKEEEDQMEQIGPIDPNILPGYAYLMGDYFSNCDFNMAFSKQRSPKQARLRVQYNNLSKVNLNNKTRDEKLQHRRKKKEIKEQLAIEEKKRLDFISEEKKEYHFIKLLNENVKIRCQFDEKEIMLAKKCRLNNLGMPPNYELPQATLNQKEETKSMKSISVVKTAKQDNEVNPNIDDFSMLQNVIEPLERHDQGVWIKNIDFLSCFTNVQIIYNPSTFAHKSIEKIGAGTQDGSFIFDETKQILVVEKLEMNEEGIEAENIDLLFGFSYQESKIPIITSPYCVLQKFDFDQFSVTSNVTKLDSKIDSTLLTLKNQNNVFKIYTMCKSNYCYWVSSNAKFKLMSISEYLQEFEGYKKKSFNVEYPAIEGKCYFPIARFGIKETSQQKNSVVLKINSPNHDFVKNTRYNLVKIRESTQKIISNDFEGVIIKSCQEKHLALEYTRLSIQPKKSYDLVLETSPSENLPDGSCEIIALIKNESLNFDHYETVEPLKVIDKYIPNKYGLIFRERIFSNVLTKQGFLVKIVEGQEVQGGGDKKAAKKGGKQEPTVQYVEKPYDENRTIIVKVVKNKQIIYETIGINWTIISNIRISNLKEKPTDEYFLEAHFDLREWPEACNQSENTAKLCWTVSVFGTDSIALVRDTRQEQRQKATRKSWEDQEPGRAERAKKSRRRFLILQKKQQGQQLTQQQEQIINLPRLTKKQQLQEDKKNEDKNKKGGKKDDKKAGKDAKKQQAEEKSAPVIFPKSIQNCNFEIRNFLKTLENFSVRKQEKDENEEPRIRSTQELTAIKESQKMVDENRINKMLRNVERRQTIKLKERDKKDQLLIQFEELNRQFKYAWSKYVAWRNQDLEKDKIKQEKQRIILDILKQEKPTLTEADLDKILSEYHQISGFNEKLYDVGVMLKKNIKILALTDKISGHLTGWEVEQLKAINEQIKNEKIEGIIENILNDMKMMLQEVEKNPAIVTEKQNEAKKAKKGGKK